MWQGWINAILGIILLVMTYTATSTTWFAIMSILIIIFSIWSAVGSGSSKQHA
jgi:hypothetical protein